MFRVLTRPSPTSRAVLSSQFLMKNQVLVRMTQSTSSQTKTVHASSSEEKKTNRRNPSVNVRQVNLRKLFSDEESPTVIPSTNHLSLKSKSSAMEELYNSKSSKPTNKQSTRKETVELKETISMKGKIKHFDESSMVSNRLQDILKHDQGKMKDENEIDIQKPRQPKPLSQQKQETKSRPSSTKLEDSGNREGNLKLRSVISQSLSAEELLKILDQYVVATEFALGLQKLCQMASTEDTNAIQTYSRSESGRRRVESLLLNFVNQFSDHEVLTGISFVLKFYPEDNEFTDKYSLALNNRLRRISVHQIVRILEELKSNRYTVQWAHRIYNRLLALAEGRYFEFDNIKDILSLTYKLSYNDRLISRLDERILEITDSLTFDDWFKVLVNKSMLKRRDRTVIRAACYHLLKLSEASLFPLEKIKDCLLACAMLNVYDKGFLERLVRDANEQINNLKDPFLIQSIVTSMGTLRLRHCELLDAVGQRIVEEPQSFGTSKNRCIQAFIRTCAAVNYLPSSISNIVTNHLSLSEATTEETNPLTDLKNRIDIVWSLAILDQAAPTHVSSILNQESFQMIQNEVTQSKIASALKLLSTYSYSAQKFSNKFLKPTFNIEQLAQQLTSRSVSAQEQINKTIASFAPENKLSKFNVITSNMIIIDCLLVVDKMGTPQDLTSILTGTENPKPSTDGQTSFNRVKIGENRFKVALKFIDYQDKTLLSDSITGSLALQLRLLGAFGYKCALIHYDEFIKIQVPNDRVNYVQRKVKEAINASTSDSSPSITNSRTQTSTNEKVQKSR